MAPQITGEIPMACFTKKMITEIPHECVKSKAFTMKLGRSSEHGRCGV